VDRLPVHVVVNVAAAPVEGVAVHLELVVVICS
jgi:hypothetical protein